ncbi:lysylphosphatidylglycerol synthase domain-containing protein [Rhodococcus sp. X156]|uniref:lysylphosphatidylglycerol synthase domain-containing protein n=1 Tax=Rhodococcus sp. X156 TaxID=2499145 RepID=UPI000FDCBA42|nr:lysylphosphatidylglycerol synthase domain-containing protein [Rhodococcus sp. X156]
MTTTPAEETPAAAPRRGWVGLRALASVAALATVVGLLLVLPRVLGTSWDPVSKVLAGVPLTALLLLAALWLAGLWSYTWVLTAALPGLTHRQALMLNLTGSAVANVAPFGGAAGVGLNFAMIRSWRFTRSAFATFTAVSNLWDWLGKLVFAGAVLAWLLSTGTLTSGPVLSAVRTAVVVLALVLVALLSALSSHRVARGCGTVLDQAVAGGMRLVRSPRRSRMVDVLPQLRSSTVEVIQTAWLQMSVAVTGYLLLQVLLLGSCLHLLGEDLPVGVIAAGFAVERLLTLVPITPNGAGFAETACAGMLIALGGGAVGVAAAVLLYRGFTFLLEIPVGGLGIVAWLVQQSRRRRALVPVTTA